ncbi:hypothetical protein GF312_04460 [Candidatus Poribacteria bacterium]|nr:hypothetical protein [Candidatus Poribacteria bacterium]
MTNDLQKPLDENINIDWETSQKNIPEGKLPFLTPNQISKNTSLVGFPQKAISYLKSRAKYISNHENIKRLAWHFHYLLCYNENFERSNVSFWSDMTDIMGDMSGSFLSFDSLISNQE